METTTTESKAPVITGSAIFYGIAILLITIPYVVLWLSNNLNEISEMMYMIYPGCIVGIATGFIQTWRVAENEKLPHFIALLIFVLTLMYLGFF